jgi:hypothetical protein
MSPRVFLKVLAVFDIFALGLVWLLAPRTGLDPHTGPQAVFVARALGTDLIAIGAMNWLISTQAVALIRLILWPNLLMHAVPAMLGAVLVLNGTFGPPSLVGVAMHAVPALAVGYLIVASRPRVMTRGSAARSVR